MDQNLSLMALACFTGLVGGSLTWLAMSRQRLSGAMMMLQAKTQELLEINQKLAGENRLLGESYASIKTLVDQFSQKPVMAIMSEEQITKLSTLVVQGLARQSKSVLN